MAKQQYVLAVSVKVNLSISRKVQMHRVDLFCNKNSVLTATEYKERKVSQLDSSSSENI